MLKANPFNEKQLNDLSTFLKNNNAIDLVNANLKDDKTRSNFKWYSLVKKKDEVLKTLEAYQRIAKLMPVADDVLVKKFLSKGIHSALQVASIPKEKFLSDYLEHFGNDQKIAAQFYSNAVSVKTRVLLQFMQAKQRGEPHVSQTNLAAKI